MFLEVMDTVSLCASALIQGIFIVIGLVVVGSLAFKAEQDLKNDVQIYQTSVRLGDAMRELKAKVPTDTHLMNTGLYFFE
jgi:hypothetical protein